MPGLPPSPAPQRPVGLRLIGEDIVIDLDDRITYVGLEDGIHMWDAGLTALEHAACLQGHLRGHIDILPGYTSVRFGCAADPAP